MTVKPLELCCMGMNASTKFLALPFTPNPPHLPPCALRLTCLWVDPRLVEYAMSVRGSFGVAYCRTMTSVAVLMKNRCDKTSALSARCLVCLARDPFFNMGWDVEPWSINHCSVFLTYCVASMVYRIRRKWYIYAACVGRRINASPANNTCHNAFCWYEDTSLLFEQIGRWVFMRLNIWYVPAVGELPDWWLIPSTYSS